MGECRRCGNATMWQGMSSGGCTAGAACGRLTDKSRRYERELIVAYLRDVKELYAGNDGGADEVIEACIYDIERLVHHDEVQ